MIENPNYKDDMSRAFQGDPNDFMNSLKDEEYKKYIHKKYELIMQFFQKIDTNKDGMLSYNELVVFLDTNMAVTSFILPQIRLERSSTRTPLIKS